MKKIIFLLVLSSLFAGCNESTRDRRLAYATAGTTSSGYQYGSNFTNTNDRTTITVTPTPTTTSNVPSDATHCKWSTDGSTGFERQSSHLGDYTLCQSKTDETKVYIQVKTVPSSQVCIIPTSSNGTSSVYIGEPRCTLITSNTTIYPVTLLKNRTNFASYKINSAMVMKDLVYYTYGYPYVRQYYAVDAYLECYRQLGYGDPRYCVAFNALGQHVFHQF